MKAFILAAGLGTRLSPYTDHTPKALFTINGLSLLGITIEKLQNAGFQSVMVNTHHHYDQIEQYIASHHFEIPVTIFREVEILGTGGAIRNVTGHWDSEPLLVINADVVTDLDLAQIYHFHTAHDFPVTMVMHDRKEFNSVGIDGHNFVTQFNCRSPEKNIDKILAFTGIHVINQRILNFLPAQGAASIIDIYAEMIKRGEQIKAFVVKNHYWQDIGTPSRYRKTVIHHMAPLAFQKAYGALPTTPIQRIQLHGDGSDRLWYRLKSGVQSLIMVDHGIRTQSGQTEVDSYVQIGNHLAANGIGVPRIYLNDNFAGLVFLEDLGDTHLQNLVKRSGRVERTELYHLVLRQWIVMGIEAGFNFDPLWTYQTSYYDQDVILEKECRYFMEAFVRHYLGWDVIYRHLQNEFEYLAHQIAINAVNGFMHRDFQSRNIMVHKQQVRLIDFQGGRLGPIQYDLASLLIDPYVSLSRALQEKLLNDAAQMAHQRYRIDIEKLISGYRACAIARNLQILGAFAFLSTSKGKSQFHTYIPLAVRSLSYNLSMAAFALPKLTAVAHKINSHIDSISIESDGQDST